MRAGVWILSIGATVGCQSRDSEPATRDSVSGIRDSTGRLLESRIQNPESPSSPRRILIVGTSLTAGLGLEQEEAYPARLAERIDSAGLNYRVVNAGVSGETSAGALRRIEWLVREPVDILVIETGANDGLRGLGVDSMAANIQAIIDRTRAANPAARIVIVGMEAPPNLGADYTAEFRGVFPVIARRNQAALVPFLLDGIAGVDSLNQADGIHPNIAGARVAAENVWRVLGPMLQPVSRGL